MAGKCFLDILLRQVSRFAITDIILVAGYLGEKIKKKYDGSIVNNCRIRVVIEPQPLGTGGAIAWISEHLDDYFFVLNGDSFFDISLTTFARLAFNGGAFDLCIALNEVDNADRYGNVKVDANTITAFDEKVQSGGKGLVNAGVYLFNRQIIERFDREVLSLEKEVIPDLLESSKNFRGYIFSGYFIDIGLPQSLQLARQELPSQLQRKAIFFDRDNTLNKDKGYTFDRRDLDWINGARQAIAKANEAGYLVVIVSNQSGIGRGLFSEKDLLEFHQEMQSQLFEIGAHIDALYWCPYHEDAALEHYRLRAHPDRKPNPGMIIKAIDDWSILHSNSILLGDKDTDVSAGQAAGINSYLFDPKTDLSIFLEQVLL